jgi:hypothetical protein
MAAPAKGATRTVTCEGCGLSGHPNTMYQMVTGWQRRGSTSVIAKRFEQRFACKPCVEAFGKSGTSWTQLSLLDGGQS